LAKTAVRHTSLTVCGCHNLPILYENVLPNAATSSAVLVIKSLKWFQICCRSH